MLLDERVHTLDIPATKDMRRSDIPLMSAFQTSEFGFFERFYIPTDQHDVVSLRLQFLNKLGMGFLLDSRTLGASMPF